MKILINASNIKLGGVLQITISFLNEIAQNKDFDFVLIVNNIVKKEIDEIAFGENYEIHTLDFRHPFQKGYTSYINSLNEILERSQSQIAFSIFGPAYWLPKVTHVVGFAYGWAVNPDSKFIRNLPLFKKIKLTFQNALKSYYFRNEADYYIVETEVVKQRLSKFMQFPLSKIFVVSNTYNHFFDQPQPQSDLSKLPKDGFKLLTIATNYTHKNLKVYKPIVEYFRKRGIHDIFFIVTLPSEEYEKLYPGGDQNIINVGKVSPKNCPDLYHHCDAMILPTLLESFSACYPEAMITKKPILTSDLDFARNICGDSAVYFDPYDPIDIATKILKVKERPDLQNRLIQNGLRQVKTFLTAQKRADTYLKIVEEIAKKQVSIMMHARSQ